MAQPTIYLTKDGYIIKTSQDLNFELIRTEKGFMTRNLGKGIRGEQFFRVIDSAGFEQHGHGWVNSEGEVIQWG